ncbi:MAG: Asp-tRNA(Asn)/Glu-tRNA(Gln) amidotransferase subunit GatA [Planctomycetota bacterium]|jgi:aspartyl-tRNA(Asn)/glutamyl-tRNA(Gln) amidotransferase subunit A|nr:Asp-tRNA(Asn)/Glu-tRNA(Gln) amidotransferase subunit GatA [Planctomycetota bacterium]
MPISHETYASLTLEDTLWGLRSGAFTAPELLDAALARIDACEPAVNAVITMDIPGATKAAGAWPRNGTRAGTGASLAGAPIAVKDNLMTRGLKTTCGSRILGNFVPPYDAGVVEKLRAAGAVIVCKTNMDEFAMGSSGRNSAYGATGNPWNPKLVPGGSSSGSAAIVAYGGVPAAIGTDTGGSIRQPASFCGLVGMKPTYGRVSRWGVGALGSSLDQVGPITRTVRDNALLFDIIAGHDGRDSSSLENPFVPTLPTIEDGVAGLRTAYDPGLLDRGGVHPAHAEAIRFAVKAIRGAGGEVVEVALPLVKYGVAAYYIICACESSANLARFDGVRYGVRERAGGGLWDTYSKTRGLGFGDEVKRRIMMGAYALSSGYYDAYYLKAARVRRLFATEYEKLLAGVDVVLLPVTPAPPRPLDQDCTPLENYLGDVFTVPANMAGIPALAFPVGTHDGLPVGVQAMAGYFREDALYRLARTIEKEATLSDPPWARPAPEAGQ